MGIQQQSDVLLSQTETEIPPDPMEMAKESLKDLQSMVEQGEAKAMGFNCFEVYKKFRKALTHPGKKADQVYARVKVILKSMDEEDKAKEEKTWNSSTSTSTEGKSNLIIYI